MALIEDVRYGLRTMAKNPGFTAIAVLALALGIGVNAAVFAITNEVAFKNMPFMSDRILYLSTHNANVTRFGSDMSYPDYRDWSAQSKMFAGMALYNVQAANLSDKGNAPERYTLAEVTANTFSLIGQQPVLGRDFTAGDDKPGAAAVTILSDRIWTLRYGRNRSVLGSIVRINSVPTTVIGVMRPAFRFPLDSDLWTPFIPNANSEKRDSRDLAAIGKLAPGATQISALTEMNSIAHNLAVAYPNTNNGISAKVETFTDVNLDSDTKALVAALMGAVLFVLLIACANVANMLLSRAV